LKGLLQCTMLVTYFLLSLTTHTKTHTQVLNRIFKPVFSLSMFLVLKNSCSLILLLLLFAIKTLLFIYFPISEKQLISNNWTTLKLSTTNDNYKRWKIHFFATETFVLLIYQNCWFYEERIGLLCTVCTNFNGFVCKPLCIPGDL